MRAEDPVGGVSVTEVIATPGSDTPADASDETEMPSWPLLQAVWMVFLVVKKNLQLRSNRPTATILEVLFPLVAFVALAVLTPRNEYFDAAYTPAAPWMPPACVLQHALPTSLNGTEVIPAALIPKVCPGAGHLSGPHVVVPFAPDTNATRYLMRAICELRYAPPGVEVVGYSHTTMATRGSSDNKISMALPKSSSSANPVSASETNAFSDETASRRKLLFGPSQSPPGPPAPPSPPPAPSWPACTPTGYVDEETMARAVANGAAGGHADAVAIFFALDDETGGAISKYEIRAAADADNRALEMQERIGDVFVALAGTGSIIDVATTLTTNPPTPNMYRQFPMDPVYATGAFTFVAKFLPLTLVVTWTYTLLVCAGNVSYEREKGLEAAMRAMGVPLWAHWSGHAFVCALLLGTAALFCGATVTSFGASLFTTGDSGRFVFLLLSLCVCAAVSQCFVVACVASDSSTAAAGAAIGWLVSYLPYAAVSGTAGGASDVHWVLKAAVCFLPASAQGLGFAALAQWEASGLGVTWATLWSLPPANAAGDVGVPLGLTLLILLCDAFGLAWLALQVDARRFRTEDGGDNKMTETSEYMDTMGSDPKPNIGIVANNLSVTYPGVDGGEPKTALRNVSLNCPVNEITVLLGHNGSGKSSLISRVVGAAAPSQGTAVIGGFPSISMRARKSLGFCPQHDTLWDDLTVQDHVDFVLRLRGVRGKKTLEEKRNTLLKEVELRAKKRYTAKSLSGGMRRRLSVALAFAGDPPNVVLDEPTAGVDPRARRQIQNLLLKKAKGKAVLITTHHLDEAERLGTRVAVLYDGEIACAGSSRELKLRYDVGYRVVVTVTCGNDISAKDYVAEKLVDLFAKQIPPDTGSSTKITRQGAESHDEISLYVPMSVSAYLPTALRALDDKKITQELGVVNYGLAAPSLDGVFRAVQRENAGKDSEMVSGKVSLNESEASNANGTRGGTRDGFRTDPSRKTRVGTQTTRVGNRWLGVVLAVAYASVSNFRRDKSRVLATFVAPCVLLLAASAMATFPAMPSTYGGSLNVPVPERFVDWGKTTAFAFSCAGSKNDTRWVFLETEMTEDAKFVMEWVDGVRSSDTGCYAENSMWAHFNKATPGGLRQRQDLGSVGVALGAGGDDTSDGAAATVWWSSSRLQRTATASLSGAEGRYRLKVGVATSSFVDASQLAVATSAAHVVDKHGSTRPWPKTNDATRRSVLASSPGPPTAAAAVLLATALPPCLAAAAAARERASGLRRVLLVSGASKSAHWLGVFLGDFAVLVPATGFHVAAVAITGWDSLGGAPGLADVASLLFVHVIAATAFAHLVATWIGEDSAANALPSCLLSSALPGTFFAGLTYALDALGDVAGADSVFASAQVFPGYAGTYFPLTAFRLCDCPYIPTDTFLLIVPVAQGVVEVSVRSAFGRSAGVENGKEFELENDGGAFLATYEARGAGIGGLRVACFIVGLCSIFVLALVDGSSGARAMLEQCLSSEVEIRKAVEAEGDRDEDVVAEETRLRRISGNSGNGSNSNDDTHDTPDTQDVELGEQGTGNGNSQFALRLLGLRKSYLGSSKPAVRDLWLEVAPGTCFGLLGINGCGKTTTFRIAAGDLPPTAGRVEIKGESDSDSLERFEEEDTRDGKSTKDSNRTKDGKRTYSKKRPAQRQNLIGYCPQRDAIVGTSTVVEHLRLVASARGFVGGTDKEVVSVSLQNAGLASFANVRAGSLSGGNKRKLCLAMSLLGLRKNGLALLDEPTAGVDPDARDVITAQIRTAASELNCAVVVTSHAVEDVGVLCQKVGVMVDGGLLCLGAPQRLRAKHGKHMRLTIYAPAGYTELGEEKDSPNTSLDDFVRSVAPGATRTGSHASDTSTEADQTNSNKAARAFGFVEDDSALAVAKAVASTAAAAAERGAETSPVWDLPAAAAARLPDILEALELRRRGRRMGKHCGDVEGYSIGQVTLEDVFLDFASRGAARSDAQAMAMEDALFAHRLKLSKKE